MAMSVESGPPVSTDPAPTPLRRLAPVGADLKPVAHDLPPVGADLAPVGAGLAPVGPDLPSVGAGHATPTVLHVAQPTEGGVARCVVDLVAAQATGGWRVTVACPPDGVLPTQAAEAGAEVLPWPAGRQPGPGTAAEARRLADVLSRTGPDVVHLHSSKAGVAGRAVLRGKRPTVFQPHAWSFHAAPTGLRQLSTLWERRAHRWADAVVCVSEAERDQGLRAGIDGRYVVVPNGVRPQRRRAATPAERASVRARLGLPADGPVAVCVGRLCRQKGQSALLAAWRRVSAVLPRARLVLVGDGPDATELRRLAGPGVSFTGAVADPVDWYAAADVVTCPSRWEGMALVPLEAMAQGRSVVASDVAGMAEAVPPDAGALVPPDDVPALADALVRRLGSPGSADAEGRRGRAHVAAHHTVARTTAAVDRLYRGLLVARRNGGQR